MECTIECNEICERCHKGEVPRMWADFQKEVMKELKAQESNVSQAKDSHWRCVGKKLCQEEGGSLVGQRAGTYSNCHTQD